MATAFPADWNNLIDKFEVDSELFNTFYNYRCLTHSLPWRVTLVEPSILFCRYKSGPHKACIGSCKTKLICSLKTGRLVSGVSWICTVPHILVHVLAEASTTPRVPAPPLKSLWPWTLPTACAEARGVCLRWSLLRTQTNQITAC